MPENDEYRYDKARMEWLVYYYPNVAGDAKLASEFLEYAAEEDPEGTLSNNGTFEGFLSTLPEEQAKAIRDGNPGELPLHESLARIANWVDYEAEVVEAAAKNVDDSSIQNEAEKQADEMRDAADSLQSASEQAAETAAEIYNETHVPSTENPDPLVAGNCGPDGTVIGGNPTTEPELETVTAGNPGGGMFDGYTDQELGALHSDISRAIREGFVEGNERKLLADIEAEIERRGGHTSSVTTGNPDLPNVEDIPGIKQVSETVAEPLEEKIEEAAASEISTDIPPEPTDWLFKNRFAHR